MAATSSSSSSRFMALTGGRSAVSSATPSRSVKAIAFRARPAYRRAPSSLLRSTGADPQATFAALDETSQPLELLLSVDRDGPDRLGAQVETKLRRAIREGALRAGTRVPSTRDLARQLGVSRRIVVDAYSQLAAEGYLVLRQGARPTVSEGVVVAKAAQATAA